MISHHGPSTLIVDYASGALPDTLQMAVAAHLSYCTHCQKRCRGIIEASGAILEHMPSVPLKTGSLDRLMGLLSDETNGLEDGDSNGYSSGGQNDGLSQVEACQHTSLKHELDVKYVMPGNIVPKPVHHASAVIVVLGGGFSDQEEIYRTGDLYYTEAIDPVHLKALSNGPCICIIASGGFTADRAQVLSDVSQTPSELQRSF